VILFGAVCALLIALALAFILPPLRHPERIIAATTTIEANVAVYRRQLAETEADLRHGVITTEQFLRDRDELEQRLVADLPNDFAREQTRRTSIQLGSLYHWLAIGLPLMAILLYLILGTPPSLQSP
jgi:cytochrome c-type biogenesis protein CcmI